MKSTITSLCSLLVAFSSFAQTSVDFITFPPIGDSIVRYVDPAPDIEITAPGPDQMWVWTLADELAAVTKFDTNDRADLFPLATHKVDGPALDNYYDITDEQWNLLGTIGQDPVGFGIEVISFYVPGLREEYAPVMQADTFLQRVDQFTGIPLSAIPDSLLDLLPIIPDSMRAKITITTRDTVDAWGSLDINGNITEVLRQKREQRIIIAIEAKISILPWQDITNFIVNYLDFLPEDFDLIDTFGSYRFLAPNYGFPVAEVTVNDDTIVNVTYQQEILSSSRSPKLLAGQTSIYPNPSSGPITVDIPFQGDFLSLRIFDSSGRDVHHSEGLSYGSNSINPGGLPNGMYLVTIWDKRGMLVDMAKLIIQ